MMTDPRLARPTWRARTNVDAITIAAIEKAERIAGKTFVITQGSYQAGAGEPLSTGTHDKGGAVDIRWDSDGGDVLALRKAGFAAWHRTPAQGPWPDHIHAVLVDHPLLASGAAAQVASYRRGRNGLAGDGPDDGPRLNPIPVFTWPPEDEFDMDEKTLRKIIREELDAHTVDVGKKREWSVDRLAEAVLKKLNDMPDQIAKAVNAKASKDKNYRP